MDEAPNSCIDIIDDQDLYSSTITWANEFDFGDEAELSKIFDMTQEHHVNEQQPMTTTNISSNSSTDKNFSSIAYPITLDDDDDYSLSYIYSMGSKNVSMLQEDGGTSETTNDMILQQTLPKIPILEKFEREASLKSKFLIDQPLRTSTDSWKEEESHKMSHILTLEKLESHLIKSKFMVGQENGILSSLDNEFPQSTRVGQNSSESMFNIPQNFNEYRNLNSRKENEDGVPGQLQSNSWNTQDSHFNTTTNWPWDPFH
ncbi:hypothetical protein R3W88_001354 [Solanum pinnatisectum]|uniref:Uncharacterized protein n=1 Tax=Solanum pinnatisectum TaxID=50273 RepID=A0AAV9MK05_9SOLN|nr:hypothetical protein R3W88_001354 [Solanum pinnatisectum]